MSEQAKFIDVKELIRTTSLEELNRRADAYFKQFFNPDCVLAKPFYDANEMTEELIAFALVARGLELFRGMTVLDFGAGSCWATRILTQLGCEVIALDVSPTALDLGRELFRRNPIIGPHREPRFLLFDGRRIELPDESVDGVVSISSLHHVPNPDEILAELARVCRPGATVGFVDVGDNHSLAPQSQMEMRNHGVVENDIDIHAIWATARQVGFARLEQALFTPHLMLASLEERDEFLDPSVPRSAKAAELERAFQLEILHHQVFFLRKSGQRISDSRARQGLLAELRVQPAATRLPLGTPLALDVVARNAGAAVWLPSDAPVGPVRFGGALSGPASAEGQTGPAATARDYFRWPLPARGKGIAPGETVEFKAEAPCPPERGRYQLRLDLVSEFVCWFEANGSPVVVVEFEVV